MHLTSSAISDLKDSNKFTSDNYEKAKTFNMFFTSVFMKESDTLPEFQSPSENTINSISFNFDKVKSKLEERNP